VSLFKKEPAIETVLEIPVLCKLWTEDGVVNGVAEGLDVAVFGADFDEAKANLADAIIGHLEALQELGKLDQVIEELRSRAREDRLTIESLPLNQTVYKFAATRHNRHILALA